MVNMKYYLVLLISVFLSLGIGMVVGISLQSKDVLETQHGIIAQRLEEEFVEIRNENRQLKQTLVSFEESQKSNRELYESMFNAVVRNKLTGLKVSLIETGDEREISDLISVLKLSGASIESSITLGSSFFRENQGLDDAINASSQIGMEQNQLYDELAGNLLDSLSTGQYTPLIKRLNELRLIHSSIDLQNSCDAIILAYNGLNKGKESIDKFSNNFIKLSLEYNIPIIVVQTEDANLIDLDRYKKMGISTIDHVNTIYGKLSLVSLLYGNKGNYGYTEGSDGVLPEELFPLKHGYYFEQENEATNRINDEIIGVEK